MFGYMNLSHEEWHAELELDFSSQRGQTTLSKNKHCGPLLVQKALYPEKSGVCHAVILHPPAGIAGGDHLDISVHVFEGSKALLTTPGATKWYKANGKPASQTFTLNIHELGHLDYLPQENIFFDEVSAQNKLVIRQAVGSSLIAWEISQLGRVASGESWLKGQIQLETELYLNEKLIWLENGSLDALSASRHSVCGLDGFAVLGTIWMSSIHVSRELSEEISESLTWSEELRAGVSFIELEQDHGLIVIRALATETEDIKNLFISLWMKTRQTVSGLPAQYLRMWNT